MNKSLALFFMFLNSVQFFQAAVEKHTNKCLQESLEKDAKEYFKVSVTKYTDVLAGRIIKINEEKQKPDIRLNKKYANVLAERVALIAKHPLAGAFIEKYTDVLRRNAKRIAKERQDPFSFSHMPLYVSYLDSENHAIDSRLIVRWIDPKKGYGVFATENIPAGTVIGEYTGERKFLTLEQIEALGLKDTDYFLETQNVFNLDGNLFANQNNSNNYCYLVTDALKAGNETRFINHATESFANLDHQTTYDYAYVTCSTNVVKVVGLLYDPNTKTMLKINNYQILSNADQNGLVTINRNSNFVGPVDVLKVLTIQDSVDFSSLQEPVFIYTISDVETIFITKRDIKAGEELTWDYGPSYWKNREITPIE